VIAVYQAQGKHSLVVLWDNAPGHATWRRDNAWRSTIDRSQRALRVLLFPLPVHAPWLMPLKPIFGQTKRAVRSAQYQPADELQHAVDHCLATPKRRPRQNASSVNVTQFSANEHEDSIYPVVLAEMVACLPIFLPAIASTAGKASSS
jgi:hypothetical protein